MAVGAGQLELPLESGASTAMARLDPAPGFAGPWRETTEPVHTVRLGEQGEDGTVVTETRDDLVRVFVAATGFGTESSVCQRFEIRSSDPLSARVQARWVQRIERTDWRVVTESVTSMYADGYDLASFTLKSGDTDFPFSLNSARFRIYPTRPDDTMDWESGAGTGGYILQGVRSGSGASLERNPNYWNEDRAFADEVELLTVAIRPHAPALSSAARWTRSIGLI